VADIVPLPEAVLGEVMLGEELDVVEEETIASCALLALTSTAKTERTTVCSPSEKELQMC
jgi:hypothetical protein